MNNHKAGCICVKCESQLDREVAQLRQQRDELTAANEQAVHFINMLGAKHYIWHCESPEEYARLALDKIGGSAAILREHDERVTAEKDREIADLKQSDASLQETIDSMSAEIQSWHNRLAAIEKRNRQQLAASQLREKELREALQSLRDDMLRCRMTEASGWGLAYPGITGDHVLRAAHAALAQPSDQSQLEAYVAERVKELRRAVLHEVLHQAQISAQGDLDFLIHWLVEQLGIATQQEAAPDAREDPKPHA